MNKVSYLILIITLLNISSIYSVITALDIAISNDQVQTIYFLYEYHTSKYPHIDLLQLQAMTSTLKTMSIQNNSQNIHVLIEVPNDLYKKLNTINNPKVTSHLQDSFDQNEYQNLTIENCEIRIIQGAANFIFQQDLNPNDIPFDLKYSSNGQVLDLFGLTFKDVFDEFEQLISNFEKYKLKINNSKVILIFDQILKNAQIAKEDCLTRLENLKINLNDNLLEVSKNLYIEDLKNEEIQSKRYQISFFVQEMFNPLLNLYIFKRILELSKKEKIVVIGGYYHIEAIINMISTCGYQIIKHYGTKLNQNISPLDKIHFQQILNTNNKSDCICCSII